MFTYIIYSIEQVNLTLILTVFHPTCNEDFRKHLDYKSCGIGCGGPTTDDLRPCISAKYFCDGHFNCLNNIGVCDKIPVDEAYCSGLVDPVTLDPYNYAPGYAHGHAHAHGHPISRPNVTEVLITTNISTPALPLPTNEAQNKNTIYIYPNSLMRVLWILIIVCSILGLLLLIILVIQFLKVFCYKNGMPKICLNFLQICPQLSLQTVECPKLV